MNADTNGRLEHLGVLRFSGPDAANFLQGQVSNDTRLLAQDKALLVSYSSPQGRVLAIIYLLPHSSGIFGILPRELLQPTLERMQKFVLRAKVKIDDVSATVAVAGCTGRGALLAAGVAVPESNGGYVETEGVGVAQVGPDAGRHWLVAESGKLPKLALGPAAPTASTWRLADIYAGLPQIYAVTREVFVAQMLNLDLIDGISFSKGCYTGQEIIARTQHLGRIKRRMFHLRLPPDSWSVGQGIVLTDGRSGRLLDVVPTSTGAEALGVLNLTPAAAETEHAPSEPSRPVTAEEIALPYAMN